MRTLFLCLVCLFLTATVYAQSTTVSATVTDAGGQVWFNGTYSFSFKVAPSSPTAQYFWNGAPFSSSQTIAGNLNGSGHFSVSVPANASITPSGSTWILTVCPAATATNGCYSLPFAFATGSQDISSAVIPPAVQVSMANPPAGAAAYADSEISQPRTGSTYFNLTDSTIHACSGFPACSPWLSISGAGGSLLPSNNTWTGTNTFTNTVTLSGSGSISGSWSGSPTLTGTWNFINPIVGAVTGSAGSVSVTGITPGTNGQCVTTSAGVAVWGSCTGVPGVQLIGTNLLTVSVSGNTTSNQPLQTACTSTPCYASGVLNSIGKTLDFQEVGSWFPVNTTEQVRFSVSFNGGSSFPFQAILFTPSSTATGSFSLNMQCTVQGTGASGTLYCDVTMDVVDGAGKLFRGATFGLQSGVDLTAAITPQLGISFGTASVSNFASAQYASTHQQN
jgi:hypothetical protein